MESHHPSKEGHIYIPWAPALRLLISMCHLGMCLCSGMVESFKNKQHWLINVIYQSILWGFPSFQMSCIDRVWWWGAGTQWLCSKNENNDVLSLIISSTCLSGKSSLIQKLAKLSKKNFNSKTEGFTIDKTNIFFPRSISFTTSHWLFHPAFLVKAGKTSLWNIVVSF